MSEMPDGCRVCKNVCCMDIILPINLKPDPDILEWLNTRGIKTRVGKFLWAYIPVGCQMLVMDHTTPEGENDLRCSIYEDRPKVCQNTGCKGDIKEHVESIMMKIDPQAVLEDKP